MSYIGSVWLRDISGNTINIVDDTDGMKNVGVGDDPTEDPFGMMIGIHYEIDTMGSRSQLVK